MNGNIKFSSRYFTQIPREETEPQLYIQQKKPTIRKFFLTDLLNKLDLMEFKTDLYYTPNLFDPLTGKRNQDNVHFLTCLWQDFDNCSLEEAYSALKTSKLPAPSAVVWSGGGVHMYWYFNNGFRLQPESYSDSWLKVMKALTCKLSESLPSSSKAKVDGAVNDSARLMRMPSSYNSKRNSHCYFIEQDSQKVYSFLEDFYYPLVAPSKKAVMNREKRFLESFDLHSGKPVLRKLTWEYALEVCSEVQAEQQARLLAYEQRKQNSSAGKVNHYNRYLRRDIVKLIELRQGDMEGYRNSTLRFLLYLGDSVDWVIHVNSLFSEPLPESELLSIFESGKVPDRFPKRETIYEALNVTAKEEKELKVLVRRSTAENKAYFENKISSLSRQVTEVTEAYKTLYLASWLNIKGIKQKDIIAKVGFTRKTAVKHKKNWKGFEDYVNQKLNLIEKLIKVNTELTETISLMMVDPALEGRLDTLQEKAEKMLDSVRQLRQIVEDCSEYSHFTFDVVKLEKKACAVWELATT
ncbi:hypothetical protein [Candidatus Enterococcus willemsii]|uniref:Replication protein n=1 Tax=Candidatus Enterococcus willemsii TaxID=1857215 RepID=A0ABQ6YWX6_9ENTE|nr:hypothetical protein [Enterococcus sp. CU12B]KAF1302193.1 hypothetical protein BAU17_02120 [Enterococcus sp. CU12B]